MGTSVFFFFVLFFVSSVSIFKFMNSKNNQKLILISTHCDKLSTQSVIFKQTRMIIKNGEIRHFSSELLCPICDMPPCIESICINCYASQLHIMFIFHIPAQPSQTCSGGFINT
jgi:hypothetical protein